MGHPFTLSTLRLVEGYNVFYDHLAHKTHLIKPGIFTWVSNI